MRRILLIEDNPSDIELTKRALEKNGVKNELIVVEDGRDALDYLFAEGRYAGRDTGDIPAVTFLDLNLPRIDGLSVLERLRADPRTRRMPVVILSTSGEQNDKKRSYDLGANSYIRKPLDFAEFSATFGAAAQYWLVLNQLPE